MMNNKGVLKMLEDDGYIKESEEDKKEQEKREKFESFVRDNIKQHIENFFIFFDDFLEKRKDELRIESNDGERFSVKYTDEKSQNEMEITISEDDIYMCSYNHKKDYWLEDNFTYSNKKKYNRYKKMFKDYVISGKKKDIDLFINEFYVTSGLDRGRKIKNILGSVDE